MWYIIGWQRYTFIFLGDKKFQQNYDKAIFRPNEGLINSDDDIIPETRTADEKVADADPWIEM
jgi:hypothetical protein